MAEIRVEPWPYPYPAKSIFESAALLEQHLQQLEDDGYEVLELIRASESTFMIVMRLRPHA